MSSLAALESLFDISDGVELSLPPELEKIYGRLVFPLHPDRPFVYTNFVSTLDGVVTLATPGHESGGDISGFNVQDQMVMGLLRAAADVVVITAGSLKVAGKHLWIPEDIYPELSEAYHRVRQSLEKTTEPIHVIVTARGDIDFGLPVFQSGKVEVLIVTNDICLKKLEEQPLPNWVHISSVKSEGWLTAPLILEAIQKYHACNLILIEGGPHLAGTFFGDACLDALFLTLAPQVAGRVSSGDRYGFAEGRLFGPESPIWGQLVSVKRGENHIFLRYQFPVIQEKSD